MSPTPTARIGLQDLKREVDAVLQIVHHPDAEVQQRDSERRHQFPTAVYRRIAKRQTSEKSPIPTSIQNSCIPSPASSSAFVRSPTSALDREVERPPEGQQPGDRLHPVGHERQRDEAAREQQLEDDVQREERPHARRPEAHEPERRLVERADQVGAPDRHREDRHLGGPQSNVGSKIKRQDDGDREVVDEPRDLPAGEAARCRSGSGAAGGEAAR